MDVAQLIDHLAADGPVLASAAEHAGWDAPVPGTDWDVRQLVIHTSGVHRWATDIVRTAGQSLDTDAGRAVGTGQADDALLDWFVEGHLALVSALRAAPADLEVVTFLRSPTPLEFWARRQAHETAIHRVDAQGAAGEPVTAFDATFAQDGIAEILKGFARRSSNAVDRRATIALLASDGPSWDIRLGAERIEAATACGVGQSDALVAGSSSELYRWLWNRPSEAEVHGDDEVAELWRTVRVEWR